jgi:hypothetical protein
MFPIIYNEDFKSHFLESKLKGPIMRIQGIMKFEMTEDAFFGKLSGEFGRMLKA